MRALRKISRLPKRMYYLNRNSIPFISGDAFADSSDHQSFAPRYRSVPNQFTEISEARVLFCPSHLIEQLIEENGTSISARVLILGNSDREFEDFDFKIPKSVKHIFAQNLLFPNSSTITAIPIGIENVRLNMNGHTKLLKTRFQSAPPKILFGPFGMTHAERMELAWLKNQSSENFSYIQERLSPRSYARLAREYPIIAAPRGNGIDTHRLWETLYRGSIPVVRDSVWLKNFPFLLPRIIRVLDWTQDEIEAKVLDFNGSFTDPRAIPELWWPFWRDLIKSKL